MTMAFLVAFVVLFMTFVLVFFMTFLGIFVLMLFPMFALRCLNFASLPCQFFMRFSYRNGSDHAQGNKDEFEHLSTMYVEIEM